MIYDRREKKMREKGSEKRAQTVLGPVDADRLGITLPHEHLINSLSTWLFEPQEAGQKKLAREPVSIENLYWVRYNNYKNWDNMQYLDEDVAIEEALHFKKEGGSTIVDQTIDNLGRDPLALARISRMTGLNIIMGSGYYVGQVQGSEFDSKSENEIADEIIMDIMEGVGQTGVRAGIIGEVGCSWPLEEREKKSLRASAIAQKKTGAAISIHPGRHDESPMEIIRVLENAGADISLVIMGHCDRTGFQPSTLKELGMTGCYLGYDCFGCSPFYPLDFGVFEAPCDRERIHQIIDLIEEGFLKQVIISHDNCFKDELVRYGGPGYAHILRNILPQMFARGITREQINTIMVENPKRFLCFL
jgi:phosphotriesterase-related protein